MIPQTIHYCWFGNSPKPDLFYKCFNSWKKYCPAFEIVEWNDSNYDFTKNHYCHDAFEQKKWAFVSDYARLDIIYNHGGIYLDTDVEIVRPITDLLDGCNGFIGYENEILINSGLGFSAPAHNSCIGQMLDIYNYINFFDSKGAPNLIPCPVINTLAMIKCGLSPHYDPNDIQIIDGIKVLPIDYLNPYDLSSNKVIITKNTYMIHHYMASWFNKKFAVKKILRQAFPTFYLRKREKSISAKRLEQLKKDISPSYFD